MNTLISKVVEAALRFKSRVMYVRLLSEAYRAYESHNLDRLNSLASGLAIAEDDNAVPVFDAIIERVLTQMGRGDFGGLSIQTPSGTQPPLEVIRLLKPGVATKFKNGTVWTMVPVQVGVEGHAHHG